MTEHVVITDPNIHEPKGISTANAGEVYVANGAGSGTYSPRFYTLTGHITDISTAQTVYVAVPYSGNVVKLVAVNGTTLTGGSAATVTLKDNAGNTMGSVAFSNSSPAGDVQDDDTLSNADVIDNDFVTVETDGTTTGTSQLTFTIVIERDD